MIIARNLARLMQLNHVSESQLARELDTSVMTVRRILSAETEDPRISTLKRIADFFAISVDSLLIDDAKRPDCVQKTRPTVWIPVLEWTSFDNANAIQDVDLTDNKSWYPMIVDTKSNQSELFALRSRPSMQPRFPYGSLLIINQAKTPRDGDLILVKMRSNQQLSLRELIIDPPRWQLQPIVTGSDVIFFNDSEFAILGVLVLSVTHVRSETE